MAAKDHGKKFHSRLAASFSGTYRPLEDENFVSSYYQVPEKTSSRNFFVMAWAR